MVFPRIGSSPSRFKGRDRRVRASCVLLAVGPDYSIVGGPEGTPAQELDYPDDNAPVARSRRPSKVTAVLRWERLNKLLYSKLIAGSTDIFSSQTNEESQILYVIVIRFALQGCSSPDTGTEGIPAVVDTDGDPQRPNDLFGLSTLRQRILSLCSASIAIVQHG